MVQQLVARGKASGHGARTRERAERAIREGRTPGKPGPARKPRPLGEILQDVARLIRESPDAVKALAALLPEKDDLR